MKEPAGTKHSRIQKFASPLSMSALFLFQLADLVPAKVFHCHLHPSIPYGLEYTEAFLWIGRVLAVSSGVRLIGKFYAWHHNHLLHQWLVCQPVYTRA